VPDAVVIGAGPNGLVAANLLVDAGWDVVVVEAQSEPGGAVRSGEIAAPGFVSDRFSAFYPLGAASPVISALGLENHGLRWRHAPLVLAHPTPDGNCVALSRDLDETRASLDSYAPGDGDGWHRLYERWEDVGPDLIDALFTPFPPVRAGVRLARSLGPAGGLRFARFAMLPVRRLADETFTGAGGGLLLAGNALHTDLAPESAASGIFGWLLAALGQQVGFPVPEGGAGRLTDALVRRFTAAGGRLLCDAAVTRVIVRRGRALGVRTHDGREIDARRAILAAVDAPQLYRDMVGEDHLPAQLVRDLDTAFQWDNSTVKVDWALDGPIPWSHPDARRAGAVHIADDMDELTEFTAQLAMRQVPSRPFLLFGQMGVADPTRSPAGTETAWAYTHVPQSPRGDAGGDGINGSWDERETEQFVARIEDRVERLAPGFRDLVRGRHVETPPTLQGADGNLHWGAVNGGTASLHQQLVFRPTPGLARPETPVRNLYLASASAHPGGGVHGGPGAAAARAALVQHRPGGRLVSIGVRRADRMLRGDGY
jgi:phytoene dehydrogenase-like protein